MNLRLLLLLLHKELIVSDVYYALYTEIISRRGAAIIKLLFIYYLTLMAFRVRQYYTQTLYVNINRAVVNGSYNGSHTMYDI